MCISCVDELKLINDCEFIFLLSFFFIIDHPSIAVHKKKKKKKKNIICKALLSNIFGDVFSVVFIISQNLGRPLLA